MLVKSKPEKKNILAIHKLPLQKKLYVVDNFKQYGS